MADLGASSLAVANTFLLGDLAVASKAVVNVADLELSAV
jgi:hypothetical protein